jgi:hypothetical protein
MLRLQSVSEIGMKKVGPGAPGHIYSCSEPVYMI